MGTAVNALDATHNPVMLGRVIASVTTFGYLGSIASWWVAGEHYAAQKEGRSWSIKEWLCGDKQRVNDDDALDSN